MQKMRKTTADRPAENMRQESFSKRQCKVAGFISLFQRINFNSENSTNYVLLLMQPMKLTF